MLKQIVYRVLTFSFQSLSISIEFKFVYRACDLSSDLNVIYRLAEKRWKLLGTTSLATFLIISLINLTFAPHHMFSPMVYFIADAIPLFQQCSASNTLSLSVSPLSCLLPPHLPFDIKTLATISMLSLFAINCSDSHRCFT